MPTQDKLTPLPLVILFILAMIWMQLVSTLFSRLENNHAEIYERLGRPKISRYGISGKALVFIVARKHRTLGDRQLSMLSDASLLVFIAALMLIFFPHLLPLSF